MQSTTARSLDLSPFATRSAPSGVMMAYAVFYLLVALFAALHHFRNRDF
jgi:hypothetical protein